MYKHKFCSILHREISLAFAIKGLTLILALSKPCAQVLHIFSNFVHDLMPVKALYHQSVLAQEVLDLLLNDDTKAFFDGTLGLGGHTGLVLESFPNIQKALGTDLDVQHLDQARVNLQAFGDRFIGVESNFSAVGDLMALHNLPRPVCILLDLGVCSNHLDDVTKGFSFQADGPLHMAFSVNETENCEQLVNQESETSLRDIMRQYGEEPAAAKIARRINEYRQHQPIKTTGQLREIVEKSVHPKDRKKALTRVFQAFRIATNDELGSLAQALESALKVMGPGDRIGVMSYHSLEDRVVKRFFRDHSRPITEANDFSLHAEVAPAQLKLITRKAIEASPEEIEHNPRSRSVKFRIAEKL